MLCLAILACNSADTSRHVVTLQSLDILDLEGLQEEVVQSQQGNGISLIKAQHEGLHVVSSFLECADVLSALRVADLNRSSPSVHSHLQLHVLDKGLDQTHPVCLQRCEPVWWHWYSSQLPLSALLLGRKCWEAGFLVRGLAVVFLHAIILDSLNYDIFHLSWLEDQSISFDLLILPADWSKATLFLLLCQLLVVIAVRHGGVQGSGIHRLFSSLAAIPSYTNKCK
mmetsp:Transcript_6699/g.14692  ORF Transcript_6699/g.14692 Transcript_6699/m.14692 type:complete len:226 (-) Transcript_6699:65-742(-)